MARVVAMPSSRSTAPPRSGAGRTGPTRATAMVTARWARRKPGPPATDGCPGRGRPMVRPASQRAAPPGAGDGGGEPAARLRAALDVHEQRRAVRGERRPGQFGVAHRVEGELEGPARPVEADEAGYVPKVRGGGVAAPARGSGVF